MILSDTDIAIRLSTQSLKIEPEFPNSIQPASVEMHLGTEFKYWSPGVYNTYVDPNNPHPSEWPMLSFTSLQDETMILKPGAFVLAHTEEKVTIPTDLVARLEGKSSLGRIGLAVHVTAGYIDPGFSGQITLELVNLSPMRIILTPGMKIGQLCLISMTSASSAPYGSEKFGSHYQDQMGATVASGL